MAPTMLSQLSPFLTMNSQSSDLFPLDNAPPSPTISSPYGTPFGYFYAPMNQSSDATPIAVSTATVTGERFFGRELCCTDTFSFDIPFTDTVQSICQSIHKWNSVQQLSFAIFIRRAIDDHDRECVSCTERKSTARNERMVRRIVQAVDRAV